VQCVAVCCTVSAVRCTVLCSRLYIIFVFPPPPSAMPCAAIPVHVFIPGAMATRNSHLYVSLFPLPAISDAVHHYFSKRMDFGGNGDLRVDLNPPKTNSTRSWVRNARISFWTLFFDMVQNTCSVRFRTCFASAIYVWARRHCERSRRSARR